MRTFRAGLIGCGQNGRIHTECIRQLDGMDMVAFCDVHVGNAQKLLEEFGGDYATDDAERLYADETIDAIYISTMHNTHADYCIRALEAGKHVMVEKPLAMNVEDCLRIDEAVKRSGKKVMTAFKMRYYDMLLKAKELIPEPLLVSMQMMDDKWPAGIWANDPTFGGGNVLSQGCHSADIMRFMVGKDPIDVYAAGANYYQQNAQVDNIAAIFRFDDNVVGNLIQGDCKCPPFTSKFFMQLFAENKTVTLSDRLTTLIYSEEGKETILYRGKETGILEENKAFIESLRQNAEPPINHMDGLYATLMMLQAIKSVKSGKPEPIRSLIQRDQPVLS
ncbi:Gfo/Idh/MocA family protein [Paenibacillus pasadenensis]|uniref:Gfo/Idh/MocA family protein n=1 Tax=Paenibacillus TaxID=44249 RepID=UPI0004186C2A|nr:Gfo/Idh/MocA family oxidoreductase [Paenibacillus pasadenensis]